MPDPVQLSEAVEPILRALESLQQCANEHRAFVIIEDSVTGKFVQFSGSKDKPLWIDVPQLGIVNNGPKFESAAEAARFALDVLLLSHHLPVTALLQITFESTRRSLPQ